MFCPNCGTETDTKFCPNCGMDLTKIDMSTASKEQTATEQSLTNQAASNQTVNDQTKNTDNVTDSVKNNDAPKRNSGLSIFAFVLSFLGPLALIGMMVAVVDLVKTDKGNHKHGFSIAAILIALFVYFGMIRAMGDHVDKIVADNATEVASSEASKETTTKTKTKDTEDRAAEDPVKTKREFIGSCQYFDYKKIARNPEQYVGQNYYYTGYVLSVREGGFLSSQKYYITYQYDMDTSKTDYDVCVWLLDELDENDPDYVRILDGDIVTVYGSFDGMTETKNSLTKEKGEQVALHIKYLGEVYESD